jgi:hypothetical protein
MYWIFLVPTLFLVLLAVAAIGIKSIVKKNGRFERKCAHSLDPDAKCICGGDDHYCPNYDNVCHSECSEEPHTNLT